MPSEVTIYPAVPASSQPPNFSVVKGEDPSKDNFTLLLEKGASVTEFMRELAFNDFRIDPSQIYLLLVEDEGEDTYTYRKMLLISGSGFSLNIGPKGVDVIATGEETIARWTGLYSNGEFSRSDTTPCAYQVTLTGNPHGIYKVSDKVTEHIAGFINNFTDS